MQRDDEERDDLPPAEVARDRRRDRHARAADRAGMRTGLAKQFKQVLDVQAKRARALPAVIEDDADPAESRRHVKDVTPLHARAGAPERPSERARALPPPLEGGADPGETRRHVKAATPLRRANPGA